jgi:hypothetical protein
MGRFFSEDAGLWAILEPGDTESGSETSFLAAFRVLTLCRSEQMAEHLRQLARRADDAQTGSTMFWFNTAQRLSLADTSSVWRCSWQIAKDDTLHQLLALGGITTEPQLIGDVLKNLGRPR